MSDLHFSTIPSPYLPNFLESLHRDVISAEQCAPAKEKLSTASRNGDSGTLYSRVNKLALTFKDTGDEADFAALYRLLLQLGNRITRKLLNNENQDIVAKVAWRFYRKLENYHNPARIFVEDLKWACKRERSRRKEISLDHMSPNALKRLENNHHQNSNPLTQIEMRLERQALIRHLTPSDADCVRLLEAGWTLQAIANQCGVGVPAVRARFRRISEDVARIRKRRKDKGVAFDRNISSTSNLASENLASSMLLAKGDIPK